MQFLIRPAVGDDSPQAAEVVQAVFEEYGFTWDPDDYCADLMDIRRHYLDRGHRFWIAQLVEPAGPFLKAAVVGTAALELFDRIPDEGAPTVFHEGQVRVAGADCSLERLYVHPAARRLGSGTALLATVVEEALAQGRIRMEIWSDKKLTNAHAMYERFGSAFAGDRVCDDPDESSEWGMALPLTAEVLANLKNRVRPDMKG